MKVFLILMLLISLGIILYIIIADIYEKPTGFSIIIDILLIICTIIYIAKPTLEMLQYLKK